MENDDFKLQKERMLCDGDTYRKLTQPQVFVQLKQNKDNNSTEFFWGYAWGVLSCLGFALLNLWFNGDTDKDEPRRDPPRDTRRKSETRRPSKREEKDSLFELAPSGEFEQGPRVHRTRKPISPDHEGSDS